MMAVASADLRNRGDRAAEHVTLRHPVRAFHAGALRQRRRIETVNDSLCLLRTAQQQKAPVLLRQANERRRLQQLRCDISADPCIDPVKMCAAEGIALRLFVEPQRLRADDRVVVGQPCLRAFRQPVGLGQPAGVAADAPDRRIQFVRRERCRVEQLNPGGLVAAQGTDEGFVCRIDIHHHRQVDRQHRGQMALVVIGFPPERRIQRIESEIADGGDECGQMSRHATGFKDVNAPGSGADLATLDAEVGAGQRRQQSRPNPRRPGVRNAPAPGRAIRRRDRATHRAPPRAQSPRRAAVWCRARPPEPTPAARAPDGRVPHPDRADVVGVERVAWRAGW